MTNRKFVHALSLPEHIWIEFFRVFFSQNTLMVDEDLQPVVNNFRYDLAQDASNRDFDIIFEHDMSSNNPNILPSLVIEDLGMAALGIAINRLSTWSVVPQTSKTRSDLLRSTYVFHCCARTRGESRLMAAMVVSAMTAFYDSLLRAGLHKIEPWSIGKTTPVKGDSDEVYLDTPVQVSFETQQTWKTIEDGSSYADQFCLVIKDQSLVRYVRLSVDITDPAVAKYIATTMDVQDQNLMTYVNTSLSAADPLSTERYVLTSMDTADPVSAARYVRTEMRVT